MATKDDVDFDTMFDDDDLEGILFHLIDHPENLVNFLQEVLEDD